MSLYRVKMILARDAEFPQGSLDHGYELTIPLDKTGKLDPSGWEEHSEACRVRRFWQGEGDQQGVLRHKGHNWFLDYDASRDADDEPFFKLETHLLKEGEYLTVREADGADRTFRVVSVVPV